MNNFDWILIDSALVVLFGMQHSLLTTKLAIKLFNKYIPAQLWNIIYSAISIVFLLIVIFNWRQSQITLYHLDGISFYMVFGCMGICLIMFFYCFKYTTSFWQWIGIEQLWKTITKQPLNQYYRVRKNGLKKYIRFPHHTFLILIFWCQPVMTLDSLWMALLATIYTYIGTVHQDHRGKRLIGQEWIDYSKNTRLLFPSINTLFNDFCKYCKQIGLIRSLKG